MSDWKIFHGRPEEAHDDISQLPPPPPWRDFHTLQERRGRTFRAGTREIELVNAALYLRRPLLVTGAPGTGKSSLAHAVAAELKLGEVLRWSISSRSTLHDGLYSYDALARLRDASLREHRSNGDQSPSASEGQAPLAGARALTSKVSSHASNSWIGFDPSGVAQIGRVPT
jgi:hypothetical protein